MTKQMYMNKVSGYVAEREVFMHTDLAGKWIDPVETGKVVPVVWDEDNQCWMEGEVQ